MNRAALEHILRAASAIANEREFVVIGSQAVLGQFPEAPDALLTSIEADLYPRHAPEKSDLIDGAIGELSAFHQPAMKLPGGHSLRPALMVQQNTDQPSPQVEAGPHTLA